MTEQTHTSPPSPSNPIFKGWHVVAGGFINSMLMIGATIYSFGLFVQPIEAEFALTREQINFGYVFLLVGFAIWAPVTGKLLEKYNARAISCAGSTAFVLGMLYISIAQSPLMIGLTILLPVAFGVVSAGAFTANTVVTRWFIKKRGRALGIVAIATSAGGFVITPIFAALLSEFGWREAIAIMGIAIGILSAVIAMLLIRNRPSDTGTLPDGETNAETTKSNTIETPMTAKQIGGSRNFWLIAVGIGLLLGSDQAILTSVVPYGLARGFTLAEASLLISALTASAIGGKFAMGWLSDRLDKRLLFLVVVLCNIAFLVILVIEPSYMQIFVAALIVGLAVGGVYPVWTSLTADCFGSTSFGIAYGLMNIVSMPFALILVAMVGRSFDQTGSYDFAFTAFIFVDILAALLVYGVKVNQVVDLDNSAADGR